MLRRFAAIAVTAAAALVAASAWAQPPDGQAHGRPGQAFEGYWMGVDPLDGGDSRRSLVRRADGRFTMAGRDTVLTLCDGTDRGFISFDDGVVIGRATLRTEQLTIACTNSGASVVLHVTYQFVTDSLMIEQTRTPAGAPVSRIVFHKTDAGQPGGTPQAPAAAGRGLDPFQGYWMGTDPVDGGDARRSLLRLANGRYALAARDTVFTLCDGTDQAFAQFDDGEVIARGVMRSNNLRIQCFNNGLSVVLRVRYEIVAPGLMLEHSTRDDGTPIGTIVLHRVSGD